MKHISVLLQESISSLNLKENSIVVDATLGYGGHSSNILERVNKGYLFAFDQDSEAIRYSTDRLNKIGTNFTIIKSNFVNMKEELNKRDINKLQEETSSSNGKNISFQKSKSTAVGRAMVDKKTKELYSSIDKPEAAFVNFLILPIAMVVLGIILSIIALLN